MFKGLTESRNTREEKRATKSTTNNEENGNRNIYILNVNRLNAPTKRHRLPGWIQK